MKKSTKIISAVLASLSLLRQAAAVTNRQRKKPEDRRKKY